ncbi:MAG: DNA repair protein RecO [Proteobacteria bacterium]|nr:DNA repair protein RecO [Pseudomonadota bacterium]
MEWQDQGVVISTRRHGERDAILEVMTPVHGRHLGLVRGGRSPRHAAVLQPGNRVALTWRARLEDHLGQFTAEMLESRAATVLAGPFALHVMTHLALLVRQLPERSRHPSIYEAVDGLCGLLAHPTMIAPLLVRFELLVLSELGFGLDLAACAATGSREALCYVSPKSGRAVSREAGAPYHAKLLALPSFLLADNEEGAIPACDIAQGFALTGYFLDRHIFDPRGIRDRDARFRIVDGVSRLAPLTNDTAILGADFQLSEN